MATDQLHDSARTKQDMQTQDRSHRIKGMKEHEANRSIKHYLTR